MPALCRDCLTPFDAGRRCPACRSARVLSHPELFTLSVAHMDCDAFYASVEKRDDPALADRPVIVGGGSRGVVSTCCYIARIQGVRSAMPMFRALKLCPDAVVIKPRMQVYVDVSRRIRAMMEDLSPAVQPLSLDEAFIDLTGTERLHHAPPAVMLARLVRRMEVELGLTGSVGLSHNKFLAKIASDMDKPRGFSVIGRAETLDFLADKPIQLIWGVGPAFQEALEGVGIRTFADLRRWSREDLSRRFGPSGERLWHLARGEDHRPVTAHAPVKSISRETTFFEDISDRDLLEGHLWRLAEQVSDRTKARDLSGRTVTLKLKRHTHAILTRRETLREPTQLADRIYRTALELMAHVKDAGPFRLLGVGLSDLMPAGKGDLTVDLFDPSAARRERAERATDSIRARFGQDAIIRGRALR
ncbi:DNA polymerase IV [Haematobacter missouriensis]|uniref:DNA polymerase IV n=1 Tax=Haematobacter missouriensis TaxID=366616 RepID=A0A212APV5_9RHOB|nr:DNA polymerase IV [Haematobacter missouriensis]KFI30989.1 DNA polymerase IV [Haematobacter missouriensis]OWJ73930.1 DNA polymerase IV [Haematobacter missouriensis]OWJ83534.1 DNA polymerase IV [Haematobacter missouriensis]